MAARLSPTSLALLAAGVERPAYARERLRAGIVHLGIGAFHRAHLADVTDRVLADPAQGDWGIIGVSLRHADTRDALAPQGGLYTLALREGAAGGAIRERLRVVGSVLQVLVAPEDPRAVLERIAHPDTRIVSLTVTEKGYAHDPATGQLRWEDPDIQHDLDAPDAPRSAIGMIVHGLALREARGLPPVTLLSCDNLPANGATLRGLVLAFAQEYDPDLARWIGLHCTFPCSMVDRIVPRMTEADRARISASLGADDAWPVVGEPYLAWVIEDRFAQGRPAWDRVPGVRFVPHAEPYERVKLRMVNGAHSTLAYLGAMAEHQTVPQAVGDPHLRALIDRMLNDEVAPTLGVVDGLDSRAYAAELMARFANPALPHRTRQIAMDGSQKVPQRLLNTLRDRLRAGQPATLLALGVAGWLHYLRGYDETGARYEIDDPLAGELAEHLALAAAQAQAGPLAEAACLLTFRPVFGDLEGNEALANLLARHLGALRVRGVAATVREVLP